VIEGRREIERAYQDETVARTYIEQRFAFPLGALLHQHQRSALRRLIRDVQPRTVLEIAPGPARLTVELRSAFDGHGVVLDASAEMLAEARHRLRSAHWHFVRGNAFALPFAATFDLVYSFRLIRHFDTPDRVRLYEQVRRVLQPGGWLMFDAVNRQVAAPIRARAVDDHQHFDALLSAHELQQELTAAGFDRIHMFAVHRRFPLLHWCQLFIGPRSRQLTGLVLQALDKVPGGAPLEWIVTCQSRK
jgi:SAM-dependent methyltransferase